MGVYGEQRLSIPAQNRIVSESINPARFLPRRQVLVETMDGRVTPRNDNSVATVSGRSGRSRAPTVSVTSRWAYLIPPSLSLPGRGMIHMHVKTSAEREGKEATEWKT